MPSPIEEARELLSAQFNGDEANEFCANKLPALLAEIDRLRAEVADARDGWHMANGTAELAMRHRDAAEARAERLAEALRDLLNVSDKFTGDPDEDAATWVAANDTARAALEQEEGRG